MKNAIIRYIYKYCQIGFDFLILFCIIIYNKIYYLKKNIMKLKLWYEVIDEARDRWYEVKDNRHLREAGSRFIDDIPYKKDTRDIVNSILKAI